MRPPLKFDTKPIWEKQRAESIEAHAAFLEYKAQKGPRRSIRDVAKTTGLGATTIYHWSARYRWVERVIAFENEKERVKDKVEFNEVAAMHKRHLKLTTGLQELAALELKRLLKDAKLEQGSMGANNLSKVVDRAAKLERLIRGEVTERTESTLDLSKLTLEEKQQLKALREKAKKDE
jgi:transposase